MISFAVSESDGSTSEIILTFSGNVHFRSSLTAVFRTNNNIELKSFANFEIEQNKKSSRVNLK